MSLRNLLQRMIYIYIYIFVNISSTLLSKMDVQLGVELYFPLTCTFCKFFLKIICQVININEIDPSVRLVLTGNQSDAWLFGKLAKTVSSGNFCMPNFDMPKNTPRVLTLIRLGFFESSFFWVEQFDPPFPSTLPHPLSLLISRTANLISI